MKHMFIFISSTALLLSCSGNAVQSGQANGNAPVSGKLSNPSGEMIYLQDVNTGKGISLDSCKLNENGEFSFQTKVAAKGFYNLTITPGNFATLILDPAEKVFITGNAKNMGYTYQVQGSIDTKLYIDFNTFAMENRKKLSSIKQKQDSIQNLFSYYANQNKDQKKLDSLSSSLEPGFNKLSEQSMILVKEADSYAASFIDKNPSSFANLAALQLFSNKEASFPYFEKVSSDMKKKYPEQKNLKAFYEYVDKMKKLNVGSVAPEIKLNTPEGKELALSSLRGKVVLIDFWASWCGPCRKENPNVVRIYAAYHKKGFEVYSVSLDKDKNAWIKAIADDKLTWTHVSDLGYWQSAVVPLYEIKGIPMTILLDKEGKIVAKNLRGKELESKIAEILN
jgi:thiol-disulfide isomerase/thioredoxin